MVDDRPQLDPAAALDALETFVVGNDDLAQLEERIGRFNIFDALGIVRAEIRHSQFLAWLLDPGESHGTGQLFVRAVVMDMLARAPRGLRPCSPVELDGLDLGQVEVSRERDHIDILIVIDEPKLVFAIENKVDSTEHSGQLERYRTLVSRRYPNHKHLLVYLTRQGEEPSDEAWSPYSYADLHRTLARVRRLNEGGVGEDVAAFLDHYLRMIGSRFMDDPKIDELCERIYKNHRQALELIFERRPDARQALVAAFVDELRSEGDYWFIAPQKVSCSFTPRAWKAIMPAGFGVHCWMEFDGDNAVAYVYLWGERGVPGRDEFVQAIKADGESVGLTLSDWKADKLQPSVHRDSFAARGGGWNADDRSELAFREAARRMRDATRRMTPFLEVYFAGR